jgi:hypothetical protein
VWNRCKISCAEQSNHCGAHELSNKQTWEASKFFPALKCNRLRSRYLGTTTKRKPNRWSIWRSLILVMLWGLCEILHLLTKKRERGHVAGSPTTGRWLPTRTRRGSEIRLTTTVQHHISAEPSSSHLPLHLLTMQSKAKQSKQAHSKSNRSNLSTPIQVQQKNPTQKCTDSFLLPAKG